MSSVPQQVTIVEVGPRDGLQNETTLVPTPAKSAFIRALAESGLRHIEATSFVHPKIIPQLADSFEVIRALPTGTDIEFSALVPNEKGLERAIEAGLKRIAVFTGASETFTQKNIRMSIDGSLAAFKPVVEKALATGITVRGYVSTAFACPYEGEISEERVRYVSERLMKMGVDEVVISDTIGVAAPTDVKRVLDCVLDRVPKDRVALHFHDTYGTALANVYAGLESGVSTFDASAGGFGGCPYAPGASGNLATEDLIYMLDRMGIETGVSLERVIQAARVLSAALERSPDSRQFRRLSTS